MAIKSPSLAKNKFTLTYNPMVLIIILLAIIAAMLLMWRPWSATQSERTVSVTGETTVTAIPDEYVFYPTYEFKNADKTTALADLTKKSDAVVAKLKDLGVADAKIKTNSSGYDGIKFPEATGTDSTYTLQLTVEVSDKDLAQKIQDYLVTTTPTSSVSPQANFSDERRKELESDARDEATKDARNKADQMASNLGFKLGKVKTVTDGSGFGIMPYAERSIAIDSGAAKPASLTVQPGENEINYSVSVTYFLR